MAIQSGNIYNGVALDFGLSDVSITAVSTQIGTFKLQDWDLDHKADVDEVKDGTGAAVSRTYYNPHREASFSYYPTSSGLAAAAAQVIIPAIGTICTVTSTQNSSADYRDLVGTNWSVESSQVKATNTKNKLVTLKLMAFPGITAAASA